MGRVSPPSPRAGRRARSRPAPRRRQAHHRWWQAPRWLYRRLTARRRPVPDFLIVGAQRCGTTWTYRELTTHPAIRRAWRKEVHFFDVDQTFARGLAWYRANFPRLGPGELTGEATPTYLFVPRAAARLAAAVPRARLVVLLRDPVDRAYSQYHFARRHGRERRPFDVALDEQIDDAADAGLGIDSYLARGRYAEQLVRLFSLFPRDQVLVLRSEDLFQDPAALGPIFAFLGVPPTSSPRRSRSTRAYDPIPPPLRARLVEYYRPHNARLYDVLGRDLGWAR